ncbi:MAG: fluoride efflux transporter CrcB [Anaerolineae bacterium]|nr:fluoride efflux transporter CrcB [Anaerolineae bacterium]
MLQRILLIALAGALGTLARYGVGGLVQRVSSGHLPLGTIIVNVIGCFLFGVVWTLADERVVISDETRVIMLGGFMGAFTTFSTFIFETGDFMREARWLLATGNIAVQMVVGLVFLYLGVMAGRTL